MSLFAKILGLLGKAPPAASAPPPSELITADLLVRLGVRQTVAAKWAPVIAAAADRHRIDTKLRVSAFLANILHETGLLENVVENLNYSWQALLRQWPSHFTPALAKHLGRIDSVVNGKVVAVLQAADQQQIAEYAYGDRLGNGPVGSGDGWRYRGRGLIQITGKANYAAFAVKIGALISTMPEWLETLEGAAESAAAFWEASAGNVVADRGDIVSVRKIVNGGAIGLPEVKALYSKALQAFG